MSVVPPGRIEVGAPSDLRYGLFTVAPPQPLSERALGGGYIYETDWCDQADLTQSQCVASAAKTFEEGQDTFTAQPFAVYAGQVCGPVGYSMAEFEAKARQRLASGEQGAVELALWTGLDAVGGTFLDIVGFNNGLPDTVNVGDPDNIVHAVARMEEYAYRTQGYGHPAYIHAPVIVAAFAAEARQIVEGEDGIKRTPYGSIWVFGGGYPGTDSGGTEPAGGTTMYITGQVRVWRAGDVVVPNPEQTLDRETNQQYVLAEREFAVGYDCFLGEAALTYPTNPV